MLDRRRSNDARRHIARVQLEELKIHLRARERINGRVERANLSGSTLSLSLSSMINAIVL